MYDANRKRRKANCIGINIKEKYEFDRWKKALNVSGQALAGAVSVVGPIVDDIKTYLEAKQR